MRKKREKPGIEKRAHSYVATLLAIFNEDWTKKERICLFPFFGTQEIRRIGPWGFFGAFSRDNWYTKKSMAFANATYSDDADPFIDIYPWFFGF